MMARSTTEAIDTHIAYHITRWRCTSGGCDDTSTYMFFFLRRNEYDFVTI